MQSAQEIKVELDLEELQDRAILFNKNKRAPVEQVATPEIDPEEVEMQVQILENGVDEAASKGEFEFSLGYDVTNKDTGKPFYTREFMSAVSRAFKDKHKRFMVRKDGGRMTITVSWYTSNEK